MRSTSMATRSVNSITTVASTGVLLESEGWLRKVSSLGVAEGTVAQVGNDSFADECLLLLLLLL